MMMALCGCRPFVVAALLQVAAAIRDDMISAHAVFGGDLPKHCNRMGKTTKCCACGEKKQYPSAEEEHAIRHMWGWDAEICHLGQDEASVRVCCPRWTKECEDTDPYFFKRVFRDCQPADEQCLATECLDVAKEYQAADAELRKVKKVSKNIEENLSETYIDGKSNNGWKFGCDCACGEKVNDDPMQCKSLNTQAWMCPDIRPCCTKLEDCDTEKDPWPLEVKANAERVKKQIKKTGSAYGSIWARKRPLERMLEECVASCRLSRMSQCIDDLKSPKEKRTMRKDISWEKAIETERYEKTHRTDVSPLWDDQHQVLDATRFDERKKHQLVKLPTPLLGQSPPDDVTSGRRQCCVCTAPLSAFKPVQGYFSKVSTICIAPQSMTCDVYNGVSGSRSKEADSACVKLPPEFCGSVQDCSQDADHYSKPTTWEDA